MNGITKKHEGNGRMKIAWLGEDSSLDVPIGNNLIRRQSEFNGTTIPAKERIEFLKSGDLDQFDVIAFWSGISDKALLETVPIAKKRTTAKLITLLRATGTGIPAWHVDHQIALIKNLPLFDMVFTPHMDHLQYLEVLDAHARYLPHAIDFSRYPHRIFSPIMPENATICIGTGGMEAHRGFFWSALTYKEIKKRFPQVSGMVVIPAREYETTEKFVKEIDLKDIRLYGGGHFTTYINTIAIADVALINVMTCGASRTVLDYAVLGIPVIKAFNLNQDDPFPLFSTNLYSDILHMVTIFEDMVKNPEWYEQEMEGALRKVHEFDIKIVVEKFKNYMKELLCE